MLHVGEVRFSYFALTLKCEERIYESILYS